MPHDHIWREHESTLRDLYQVKRKTLKQVKDSMEADHGFPIFPLSVYEVKLRDELCLRKKLKRSDWPVVYSHFLERQRKPTSIFFQGTEIPWKKAWKEIRRSGARRSGAGPDTPRSALPTGVVLRTPSPDLPALVSSSESSQLNQCLSIRSPKHSIALFSPPGAISGGIGWKPLDTWSQHFPKWRETCVRDLPWNTWIRTTHSLVATPSESQSVQAITTFMEHLSLASTSGTLDRETPSQVLKGYRDRFQSAGQLSTNFDPFHFLAEVIFALSNGFFGTKDNTPAQTGDILSSLSSRIPRSALDAVFGSEFPSVHAAWETFIMLPLHESRKEDFSYLIEMGLRHTNWIYPHRHQILVKAAFLGCPNIIRYLLSTGVRADDPVTSWHAFDGISRYVELYTPVIAAVHNGQIDCARLLIDHCDVNRIIIYPALHNDAEIPKPEWSNFSAYIRYLSTTSIPVQIRLEVLDLFLEAGADLNAPLPIWMMDESLRNLHVSVCMPPAWKMTVRDWSFRVAPEAFERMASQNPVPECCFSRSRYLQAAKRGPEQQKSFQINLPAEPPADLFHFLELCLAELLIFERGPWDMLLPATNDVHPRLKLIREFTALGVDIKLPSLGVCIQDVLYQIIRMKDKTSSDLIRLVLSCGAKLDEFAIQLAGPSPKSSGLGLLPTLAELGANFKISGGLALTDAAILGNWDAFNWLMATGVDLNAPVRAGSSTIMSQVCSGWVRQVSNRFCKTPEYLGARPNNKMIRHLIQSGAKLNMSPFDNDIFTFLEHQLKSNESKKDEKYQEKIETLLEFCPSLCDHSMDRPGLLRSCHTYDPDARETTVSLFELLFRRGAMIGPGDLAVLIAIGGRRQLVEEFISAGSDVHSYDPRSKHEPRFSPIQEAAACHDKDLVLLLLENGANINQPPYPVRGQTALQAACAAAGRRRGSAITMKRRLQMVEFLIGLGANANAPPATEIGCTALHYAAFRGDIELALLLLDHRADPNVRSTEGKRTTALDKASENGRLDMVQLFLNIGGKSGFEGLTGFDGAIKAAACSHTAVAKLIWSHAVRTTDQETGLDLEYCHTCLQPSCTGCSGS